MKKLTSLLSCLAFIMSLAALAIAAYEFICGRDEGWEYCDFDECDGDCDCCGEDCECDDECTCDCCEASEEPEEASEE